MTDQAESKSSPLFALWGVVTLVGLLFLPLGLAAAEHFTVGSNHVEQLCKHMGIHDALDRVYRPVLDFFR
ncbi:MAG: hypothetical protein H7A52_14435 [Akkermansiaceae bacterium]|nr:hypothetical protein [Akkermansiaceae bacterium]